MKRLEKLKFEHLCSRFWGQRVHRDIPAGRIWKNLTLAILAGAFVMAAPVMPAVAAPPSFAIGIAVSFGPPAIPYYVQPPCPGPAYIWTPGYWAWDPDYGYYWVPGTWVPAPFVGALWTPGYWGWDLDGDDFVWYPGYWGPVVGFYGGINYGFGYTGYGYEGGYWQGRDFYYNRTVNNVNVTNVTYVYNRTVVVNNNSRISYNGGSGGIQARPTSEQQAAARQRRMGAADPQVRQETAARSMPQERASVNHGRPEIAATSKAGDFNHQVVHASRAGAHYVEPPISHATVHPANQHGNNATRPGFQRFGQPSQEQRTHQEQHATPPQQQTQRQGNWHQFGQQQRGGNARTEQTPRYERQAPPPQRQQSRPAVREQQAPPQRYERQAPSESRPAVREQQAPPQRYERQAPSQSRPAVREQQAPPQRNQGQAAPPQRNAPTERKNNGNGKDHGKPPEGQH